MTDSAMPVSPAKKRETWTGQTGFLLAAIGSAIGLGNIWRFPGVAYENGGGAFLVPYLVALLLVGIPFLCLDYAIGHKFRGTPPWALRRIGAAGEFIGWFQVMICFVIFTYYAAVIAWAAQYAIYSVNEAWGDDAKSFFVSDYLQVSSADSLSFSPVAAVAIPLALVWILVLLIVGMGISRGVEMANRIFLPLLVILFLVLVIRALFLPGALEGLNAFFTPKWSALSDPHVWLAAFAQIFYSLSIAFGIMLTYASYLKPRSNLTGTGLVAGFANSSFEILAGIGVFSALGFMAYKQGVGVSELQGLSGPILSFVTFPQIISMMPGGPLFGVLFFTSLVLAGVTSLLSLLQVVSGALQDKFGFAPKTAAMIMGIPAMVVSLVLFGTTSGLNTLDVVDAFINNIGVVGSAIVMTLFAALLGGRMRALREHLNKVSSVKVPAIWDFLVGVLCPVVLAVMMFMAIVDYISRGYGEYPSWYVLTFGWGCVALCVIASILFTLAPWKHQKPKHAVNDGEMMTEGVSQ
ncbi:MULTISPECIES: sodium-dependent transporter [unclassified Schaalia]|uniref:sodium-dependent transporter n=1 Tax=unclassified Schaalia TaxID=2691889 RepID=UPI001E364FED|nr:MULTISPECIES: sodium-dependent transporter [unclassified Schaalia]MCD4549516.1 sodium-dependent transporter [Schaalia sp. lx-260]MCD4558213.1 sodium-dependent transporter [Schaalia sp. lx-100]